MLTCTRRLTFCAGHRILGHENKCATAHGHNYAVLFTAHVAELDSLGRVVDFSVLKAKLGGWLEQYWDHTFLVYDKDVVLLELLQKAGGPKAPFVCPFNPTAENMAQYLLHVVGPEVLAGSGVKLVKVELWETENCSATCEL